MLTPAESCELKLLTSMKQRRDVPFMQEDRDRLIFLFKKSIDNHCINPKCSGYEGSKLETNCLKCNSKLYKNVI